MDSVKEISAAPCLSAVSAGSFWVLWVGGLMRRVIFWLVGVLVLSVTALATLGETTSFATSVDSTGDPVVGVVGDMACDPADPNYYGGLGTTTHCAESRVSDAMLADTTASGGSIDKILALGDYQYDCGDPSAWSASYDPTWGRLDYLMDPVTGNHEYKTGNNVYTGQPCPSGNSTAQGYFNHFGAAVANPDNNTGYFSVNLGSWHIIALNGNCKPAGGCNATSPESVWLKNDLSANSQLCTLAFWHQPLFTGVRSGMNTTYQPWWNLLYNAKADVVLNGHVHNYQRFAPMDPIGNADSTNGITEYVVGTGGEALNSVNSSALPQPIVWRKTFGYLRMTLLATGWTAQFLNASRTVRDTSSGACH
jgi:hypothetical protein